MEIVVAQATKQGAAQPRRSGSTPSSLRTLTARNEAAQFNHSIHRGPIAILTIQELLDSF
jgi:hypothetical protein